MKTGFGINDLRLLYYQYKDSPYYLLLVASFAIAICIILLFQIVIPQVERWFSISNEITKTRERIAIINNNIAFINGLNKEELASQLIISTKALPFEKDFGSIVNALSDAAIVSGVSFDDYSFQPGNIASISGQFADPKRKEFGFTTVTITLSGDAERMQKFLEEIGQKLPLSEVVKVQGDKIETLVTLYFYQKQFPKIAFKDDVPLTPLTVSDSGLYQKLSQWQTVGFGDITGGTESAAPLF